MSSKYFVKAMIKTKKWFLLLCLAQLFSHFSMIKAQSPNLISYQAIVRDANGMMVQENEVAVQISILRSNENGPVSYKERHSTITDINGMISIDIGNGTAMDGTQFDTINWGSSAYYVKSETDLSNGTNYSISGTFQLMNVPTALHAKTIQGDIQNRKITNLANPTDSSDAVTKAYADAFMDILSLNGMSFSDFWIGSQSAAINDSLQFMDRSNIGATSWQWDFGDGNSSTEQNPRHVYTNSGSYTLFLTVSNGVITQTKSEENYIVAHNIIAGGGVTDIEGNNYPSVIIGTQEWMAQNLYVTHYPDGSSIPIDEDWALSGSNDTDDAFCWMNNDATTKEPYGALYNFAAATNGSPYSGIDHVQGVCPDGWHIPNDFEWSTLIFYLNNNYYNYRLQAYSFNEAKSLAAKSGWDDQSCEDGEVGFDQQSNNSAGFAGVPVGYRYSNRYFYNEHKGAYWWSSSEGSSSSYAYGRDLSNTRPNVNKGYHSKKAGLNVRCLKD